MPPSRILALRFALPLGVLVLALSGCDSGGPDGEGDPSDDLTVTLQADGQRYETETTGAVLHEGTFFFGADFDEDGTVGMVLTAPFAEGAFEAGDDTPVQLIFNAGDTSYFAGGSSGSGTVNVTSIEGDVVRGTFAFEVQRVDGTNTLLTVSDGAFEVEVVVH